LPEAEIRPLDASQIRRYSRQLLLPEVGGAGQGRLFAARVLVVGAGGLGSPASLYLAAAGVGTLGLADGDRVELSNLQRQILHDTKDLDRPKALSGQARLEGLNPEVRVIPHVGRLGAAEIRGVVEAYDLVVEGSDDQATKLLANDAAVALGRPLVVAGILGWDGQLLVVRPGLTPCYRCVYGSGAPSGTIPSCEAAGVVGPVAGVLGSMQAVEALKLLLGVESGLAGRLLCYDGRSGDTTTVVARRDPACAACGDRAERA
jgi:adenylyltransferase/sulfurtransferase